MVKFKKYIQIAGEALELVVALLVFIAIVLSIISLLKNTKDMLHLTEDVSVFKHYLEKLFGVVIGIEFLEMLCRPNSDNVLEVLIFLVARHMIVGETTPYEDFVSVIGVSVLCIVRSILHTAQKRSRQNANMGLREFMSLGVGEGSVQEKKNKEK